MVAKPFYSELRTRQQLGYIVQCSANEIEGVRSLSFFVQGTRQPPPEVERRIDAFLRLFRGTLLLLPDDELLQYRESIAAQFENVDTRLDLQAGRLWQECSIRRYDFQRPWSNAAKMRAVTREQLLAFFDAHVADGSPTRRRLSTHVFSQRMAPASLTVQPVADDFFPPMSDLLPNALTLEVDE
uniref:Coenzyme PQQ synthesis protein F-like C-terminal lobe domain-containing protein n=1 Tax=Prymnesium polylepis TaxID=72548 RepID=A0A7S4MAX7_9EUKA